MLLSFSVYTYLYNMILSEETLKYLASCYCRLHLYIPVQYDIVRRNTKISTSMLLSFSVYTYLYNMIFPEESLRYPASYSCPSPLIYTGYD
jgi:hypothetical protein